MLINLDNSGAGFISSSIFSGILIYLLICTVKGNFKCGLRIPFLFTFHPMMYLKFYLVRMKLL
jgi:LMBR1 domain-containing protein 1